MQVVGALINRDIITNDPETIRAAIMFGSQIMLLSKQHMQFMSGCGLSAFWDEMAQSPVLFEIDDFEVKIIQTTNVNLVIGQRPRRSTV